MMQSVSGRCSYLIMASGEHWFAPSAVVRDRGHRAVVRESRYERVGHAPSHEQPGRRAVLSAVTGVTPEQVRGLG